MATVSQTLPWWQPLARRQQRSVAGVCPGGVQLPARQPPGILSNATHWCVLPCILLPPYPPWAGCDVSCNSVGG